MSGAFGIAAQFGVNIGENASNGQWLSEDIIKSRTLARAILKNKFSTNKYDNEKTLLEILSDQIPNSQNFEKDEINGVNTLLGMISVNQDINNGVYNIRVDAEEPKLSRDINKTILYELEQYQKQYESSANKKALKFVEDRIIETEKELNKAEEKLREFRARNRRMENSPLLQLQQQRLAREVTVLTGVFTTLKQQLETTKIEAVKDSDYIVVIDPPEIPLQKSRPQKKKIVMLFSFLGLGFGLVVSLLIEFFNTTSKNDLIKLKNIRDQVIKNFKIISIFKFFIRDRKI